MRARQPVDEWETRAACAGLGHYESAAIFNPPRSSNAAVYAQARRYCNTCPVTAECLNRALTEGLEYGMYGGLSPRQRRELTAEKPVDEVTVEHAVDPAGGVLRERQVAVVDLTRQGMSASQIAEQIGMTPRTIHRRRAKAAS